MTQPTVDVCVSDSQFPYPRPVTIVIWDQTQNVMNTHLTYAETRLLSEHLTTALSVMVSLGLDDSEPYTEAANNLEDDDD